MVRHEGIELLREVGLNELEAEVYSHLLVHEPLTAYAVGKSLGRATANVYKAIDALARRGAVVVEEGETRLCRAVPAPEFLRQLRRGFSQKTRAAENALRSVDPTAEDERVYRIESVAAVFERATAMLRSVRRIAVVDAFPHALAALVPELKRSARRGVEVIVEAYAPVEIDGADVVFVPQGDLSLEAWKSEQLNLVVDGKEHLLALLDRDHQRVLQAVWSRSVYLSTLHHSGRMNEITLLRVMQATGEGRGAGAIARALEGHRFIRDSDLPGHRELLRRYVDASAAEGCA
jgi:HTH-type transcriptional regulator, sugar sensing transcriptional regulator